MSNQNQDISYLHQSLELAKIRRGFCSPNPSVGAIITQADKIIATGYHFAAGSSHAEVDALQKIAMRAQDATIYITLEPCCHSGKTPPCTDAIIQAGIKRVVYGYRDPNPLVSGKTELILQKAGIESEFIPLPEIQTFYQSYHHWLKTKKPFVTAKIAMSLNGKIAGKSGERMQITGKALQEFTHAARYAHDAILTTINTVLQDDPKLNVRSHQEVIAKPIYILDSELKLPETAMLFTTAKSITVFHHKNADANNLQHLLDRGVRCIAIEKNQHGLNLNAVLDSIGQQGIHDLWVEAGGTCFSAFLQEKLLQRAFIYLAPRWIEGQDAFSNHFSLDLTTHDIQWKQFGHDVLCDIRW